MNTNHNIPAGTSEFYGIQAVKRSRVLETIKTVYTNMGFDPLETPVLEFDEYFRGHHGEGEDLLFELKDSNNKSLVLRYDLTVPLARYVANNKVPLPFKRFQIATVFRDDMPDKGHYREFIQCDGDIVGDSHPSSDASIINLANEGLTALGINGLLKVNHRFVFRGILEKCSETNLQIYQIQRFLDNLDKKNMESFDNPELKKYKIPNSVVSFLQTLLEEKSNLNRTLRHLYDNLKGTSAEKGLRNLEEVFSYTSSESLKRVSIDISLARGADYYDGFVLEGIVPGSEIGAILGGGRYDNLVKSLGGPDLPAVGMAFGFDRICLIINKKEIHNERSLVVSTQNDQMLISQLLEYVDLSRKMLPTDFLVIENVSKDSIIQYAKQRNFSSLKINLNELIFL
jgi:histidyl-tRNA synthetase